MVRSTTEKTPYATMMEYEGQSDSYHLKRTIYVTEQAMKDALEWYQNRQPVNKVYQYDCFAANDTPLKTIFIAHPNIFDNGRS